jgi:hypothetical protein
MDRYRDFHSYQRLIVEHIRCGGRTIGIEHPEQPLAHIVFNHTDTAQILNRKTIFDYYIYSLNHLTTSCISQRPISIIRSSDRCLRGGHNSILKYRRNYVNHNAGRRDDGGV